MEGAPVAIEMFNHVVTLMPCTTKVWPLGTVPTGRPDQWNVMAVLNDFIREVMAVIRKVKAIWLTRKTNMAIYIIRPVHAANCSRL